MLNFVVEFAQGITDEQILHLRKCRDMGAVPDGYPAGSTGVGGGGSDSSSVEAAVIARLSMPSMADPVGRSATLVLQWITQTSKSSVSMANELKFACDPHETVKGRVSSAAICLGCDKPVGGTEHDRLRGGLCDACRKALNRAREAQPNLDRVLWIRNRSQEVA
jgi:hypothetical protein